MKDLIKKILATLNTPITLLSINETLETLNDLTKELRYKGYDYITSICDNEGVYLSTTFTYHLNDLEGLDWNDRTQLRDIETLQVFFQEMLEAYDNEGIKD